MKSRILVAAVLLGLLAGHLGAGNCLAGEIAPGSLTKMGLAGVKKMSDREGKQVRGTGSAGAISGFAFALGGLPQGYSSTGNSAKAIFVIGIGTFSAGGAGTFSK